MGHRNKHKTSSTNKDLERIMLQTVPWYQKRLIIEHLQRYTFANQFIKNKIVVDVACGSGFGTKILAPKAKKIYAIDNDYTAISYAKQQSDKANIQFIQADAQKIPLKNGIADLVVSFETIEHLPQPKIFLNEINRILNKKGILILSTPNKKFSHGENPYHLREFTYTELTSYLTKFKTVEFYGQRHVYSKLFSIYARLQKVFSFAKPFFRFRPWEKISIEKINGDTNYLYFIAVCQK